MRYSASGADVPLLLAEDNIIKVFCLYRCRMVQVGHGAIGVAVPSVGRAANKQNGFANAEVCQGAAEIVHQYTVCASDDAHFAVKVAQCTTEGGVFGVVFHHCAIVYGRILAEKKSAVFGGLLKERRVVGNADGGAAVDDGAIAFLGEAPRQRLAGKHKGSDYLAVVAAQVGGHRSKNDVRIGGG